MALSHKVDQLVYVLLFLITVDWYTLQHYLKSNSCAHEWDSRIYFSQVARQSVHNLCHFMQRGLLLKITIQGLMTSNDCNSN